MSQPLVGSRGLWELKEPYNNLLPLNTALTCTAVSEYNQLEKEIKQLKTTNTRLKNQNDKYKTTLDTLMEYKK